MAEKPVTSCKLSSEHRYWSYLERGMGVVRLRWRELFAFLPKPLNMIVNKKWLKLGLLGIIVVFISGWLIYNQYNSVENRLKRQIRNDIVEWFYQFKSLTNSEPSVLKNETDKNKAIELRKVTDRLSDEWEFSFEDWDLSWISNNAVIVDYKYSFENKRTKELQLFSNRYYYDSDETLPIPLKGKAILVNGKNYKDLKTSRLWEGDFDAYCVKAR